MTAPRIVEVSPAERAVIGELARDGADNHTIAARLDTNRDAVRNRLKAIMRRTGHPNRTALVVDLLAGRLRLRVVGHHQRAVIEQETPPKFARGGYIGGPA